MTARSSAASKVGCCGSFRTRTPLAEEACSRGNVVERERPGRIIAAYRHLRSGSTALKASGGRERAAAVTAELAALVFMSYKHACKR